MRISLISQCAVLVALAFATAKGAEESVSLEPRKLSLFKNGFGYITLEGKAASSAEMELKNVPMPSLGTFSVAVDSPGAQPKVSSWLKEEIIPLQTYDLMEFAKVNPKALVTVETPKGRVKGLIVIPERPPGNTSSFVGRIVPPANTQAMETLLLKTEAGGYISLRKDQVLQMEFASPQINYPTLKSKTPTLTLSLEKAAPGSNIKVSCLSGGVSWVPSYIMDLSQPEKASFQARATIINELMDMKDVELELIAGFPAVKFAKVPSPLSWKIWLDDFLTMLNGPVANTNNEVRITSNSFRSYSEEAPPPIDGNMSDIVVQTEDLFFYELPRFSCKFKEVVEQPLFSGTVAYSHVYTWDIPYRRGWEVQQSDEAKVIWHCIRLENTLDKPLTTGSIEFVSGDRIAGQGIIPFTGKGQTSKVFLNKTMEIFPNESEKIISQGKAEDKFTNAVLNTVEGTLSVDNKMNKEVTVEINKQLMGLPIFASDEGVISSNPSLGSNNPLSKIKWTIKIEPKSTKKVTYKYEYIN